MPPVPEPLTMPVLPVPMVFALILLWLLARALIRGSASPLLLCLILLCAWQNGLIALVHHYGFAGLRWVQPVSATAIPPLAWLAFVRAAQRPLVPFRDGLHAAAPLAAVCGVLALPQALDLLVPTVFLGYGAALFHATQAGRDALMRTRLDSGDAPVWLWRLIGAALMASAVSDLAIAADFAATGGRHASWIIGLVSTAELAVLGLVGLSQSLDPVEDEDDGRAQPNRPHAEAPDDLVQRADRLMRDRQVFRDPDLTLGRLAARLHVPAKQLSAAINRDTGANVSRYVNGFRIAHATERLTEGANVTEAMLDSGFNTKSNFNREFLRVTGHSPSAWRDAQPKLPRAPE